MAFAELITTSNICVYRFTRIDAVKDNGKSPFECIFLPLRHNVPVAMTPITQLVTSRVSLFFSQQNPPFEPSVTTGLPDSSTVAVRKSFHQRNNLLLILISLVANNVVEAKLIDTLGGRNDAKPVTELLLLEELLRPVSRLN